MLGESDSLQGLGLYGFIALCIVRVQSLMQGAGL